MNKREGYRAVLKNKNFLALWLSQVFSQLGDRVTFVIFVATIASLFGVAASYQSWLYIAFTIPAIFLTSIAGVFIDKWNKKHILVFTNIIRAFLILLLPFFHGSLLSIYILAFLISSVTQFFVPAEASAIPVLVSKNQLLTANSLFTTTMMASLVIGFVMGDPLINIFSLKFVHYVVSFLFFLSAFCLFFIKSKSIEIKHDERKTVKEFFTELKEGFIYVKNNPVILQAILKLSTLFSIIVMLSILSITISQHFLYPDNPSLGAQKFVYIIAFSGLGMLIGALMVGKLFSHINKYKLIFSGFLLIGLNLILLCFIGNISKHLHIYINDKDFFAIHLESFKLTYRMIYSYLVASFIGFGSALVAIPVQTIMHASAPENMRGKIFGVQFTVLSTSSTLPVLIAALGADLIGLRPILLILGLPILFWGCFGLLKIK